MAVFVVGVLIFTGCGFQALKDGPKESDLVSSNGSVVVQKGDYLYFVNGLVKTSDLTGSANKYGEVDYSALYRTKLGEKGELQYDDDNVIIADVLAPKVVGFENGAFYIFGNKIYYASPNTEKNEEGEIDYTQTDFFYSNLDGTGVTKIYKTKVASTSFKFAFYQVDSKVVLAVYDSADLFMIDCSSKAVTKVAEGVTGVALPSVTQTSSYDGENYVYYTRSSTDDDNVSTGNILAMASLNTKTEVSTLKNATFAVKEFKCDKLFYTKKATNDVSAVYFMTSIADGKFSSNSQDTTKLTDQSFTNSPIVVSFVNGNYQGMVVKNESGYLALIKPTTTLAEIKILNSKISLTPLAVYGNDIYAYDSDNQLYKVDYATGKTTQLSQKDSITLDFSTFANVDFDGKYVYAFQKISGDSEDGYYLARINTTVGETAEFETLGKLAKEHIKTETEEE